MVERHALIGCTAMEHKLSRTHKTKLIPVTRNMIEKGARALYREAGWDQSWNKIDPSGRRRFRRAALKVIIAAVPGTIRKVGS